MRETWNCNKEKVASLIEDAHGTADIIYTSEVAMYSASVVLVATIDCFFDPQHIGDSPINIICPDVLFLYSISPAKSVSV